MEIKLKTKNNYINGSLILGLLSVFIFIYCLLHFMNRGFELSDETYYLYFSNIANTKNYNTTQFGLINHLACFGNPTLFNLRLAKFIYQMLAIILFTLSLFKYLDFKHYLIKAIHKWFILIIILLTSFCQYDYIPMTLSYNSWSLILMLFCFSILFIEASHEHKIINIATSIIFGIICFCLFLTKLPNSFIAAIIYATLNIFSIQKNTFLKFIGFCLGIILGYFILLNQFTDLLQIIENYRITLFDIKHAESGLYVKQIYKILILLTNSAIKIGLIILLLIAGIISLYKLKKIASTNNNPLKYALLLFIFLLSIPFLKGNGGISFNDFVIGSILLCNAFLFIYLFKNQLATVNRKLPVQIKIIIALLLAMPILLMLGTNNAFYYSTSPTMVFAIAAALIAIICSGIDSIKFLAIFNNVVCVFIMCILYFGVIKHPYKQTDLAYKNYPLHSNKLTEGILESRASFIDFTVINTIIKKYNPDNKSIITFFNFYGFTILNNCQSTTDLPLSNKEQNIFMNDYLLQHSNTNTSSNLLLVPENVIGDLKFKEMFHKINIHLNVNYKLLFKYKFLGNDETIYIFKYINKSES